jgi:hypothetical protein
LVLDNCIIVQDAAEAYAAANAGEYPEHPEYGYVHGNSLFDFLPNSELLENPATGERTEPVCDGPSGIGSTSYRAFGLFDDQWVMRRVGYLIIGRGQERDFTITNLPDSVIQLEDRVIENCLTVRTAVEAFAAENSGIYPSNLADETPLGNTVFDLFPDGMLLENPYTTARSEPVDGAAALPGETAYLVRADSTGTNTGYVITGFGWAHLIYTYYK